MTDLANNSATALAKYIREACAASEAAGSNEIMVHVPKSFPLPLTEARQIAERLEGSLDALRERDEARAFAEDLARRAREITCVWCGYQFESTLGDQAAALKAHAETCEQHPVRAIRSQVEALREALSATVNEADHATGCKWYKLNISEIEAIPEGKPEPCDCFLSSARAALEATKA